MAFELRIKNIGKLTDAKIRIGRFTVLAGPNNTGKSFVSKILYSLFNAMNANHAEVHIKTFIDYVWNEFNRLLPPQQTMFADEYSPLNLMFDEIKKLEYLVAKVPSGNFEGLKEIIPTLIDGVKKIQAKFSDIRVHVESKEIFDSVEQSLVDLQKELSRNAETLILSGIKDEIIENLIQNFQVPKLSDLMDSEELSPEVVIDDLVEFRFSKKTVGVTINLTEFKLRQLQKHSKVIYLESPVYWKLKNALEGMRMYPRYSHSRREQLSGVPGYFYDLARALKQNYTGEIAFPKLYEKLTGKDVIGGKIAISDSGDLSFQENGRNFSLPVTAMGIANLGVLALLMERKALDKDSFIFIDEPEAHLHPAWQVVMAETLFELAKCGVNVVIATHSVDILKWLEVHVKKHPEDEGLIALNKFPANGDETDKQDFSDKIAAIKQELTKPFADLYTAGL